MRVDKILASVIVLLFLTVSQSMAGEDDAPKLTAFVKTAVVKQEKMDETIKAYGSVDPDPDHTHTVPMPHDGVITNVWVRAEEVVKAGDQLVGIEIAPGTAAQYSQAEAAVKFAENDLARNKRLLAGQLATKDQVAAAEKTLSDAVSQRDQLQKTGANQTQQVIRSPFDGVITSLAIAPGQKVAADTVILTIGSRDAMIVTLGIEPEDAPRVKVGATVHLISPLNPSIEFTAQVNAVHGMVDPSTRLVDALVQLAPPATNNLVLGMTLSGTVALSTYEGPIVPHDALMQDMNGSYVFEIRDGTAHKVPVSIVFEDDGKTALKDGPKVGAHVAITGNAALEEGMAVSEIASPETPAGEKQ